MGNLLKESFELFVKNRWIKTIYSEVKRYERLKSKAYHAHHVIWRLVERYNEIYPDDKITWKNGEDKEQCRNTQ